MLRLTGGALKSCTARPGAPQQPFQRPCRPVRTPVRSRQQVVAASSSSEPHPAALASQDGSIGFGFSAGGLLFPYLLGVVSELEDLGIVQPDTKLAGASAGSLVVACHRSGLSNEQLLDACLQLADDCRKNGTRFRLKQVLQRFLMDLLPHDVHERCNGNTYVAVTRVAPRFYPELIGQFHDRQDLISALLTSCHIPWYFDGNLFTGFRGSLCFDGGITQFIPAPPSDYTVKVCCFPSKQISLRFPGIEISPDRFEDWPYELGQMLPWAFEPADPDMLMYLENKGRKDARSWAAHTGISTQQPGEQGKQQSQQQLVLPGSSSSSSWQSMGFMDAGPWGLGPWGSRQ